MATAAPHFLESVETQIDDLLMRICTEMQLDETRYKLSENSYLAVAKWLESRPLVAALNPAMYPQGSMQLGTTVRPLAGDEFDLDFVCEFSRGASSFRSPIDSLDLIEHALRSSTVYRAMVQRKNRCIRLKYEHRFHMDVLPACKDVQKGGDCILVPDRKLEQWTPSNPKGYSSWFDSRARQLAVERLLEKAQQVPAKQEAPDKPPLKLVVQLLKRRRDVRYKGSIESAPISIVLTTLAGHLYRGERSVASAMSGILAGMSMLSRTQRPRIVVLNPTNRDEDLSERWDAKPNLYRSFIDYVTEFDSQWIALLQARGIDKITQLLERLFGEEIAKRVVEKQAQDIESARTQSALGVKKGSGLLASLASSSVVAVRTNTFYGSKK